MTEGTAIHEKTVPADLVQLPSWKGLQQCVLKHELWLSPQIHHILFHVRMSEIQHSSIVPADTWNLFHSGASIRGCNFPRVEIFATWLKKTAEWANSTALSTSASSQMMKGDFPPSSNVTGFRLLFAAAPTTALPVSVDPVKAICRHQKEWCRDTSQFRHHRKIKKSPKKNILQGEKMQVMSRTKLFKSIRKQVVEDVSAPSVSLIYSRVFTQKTLHITAASIKASMKYKSWKDIRMHNLFMLFIDF